MILLNRIKYNADKNYDIYEKKLKYSNYNNSNLTNYILYVFLINDHKKIFTKEEQKLFKNYIKNLYIEYYNFYIKNIINYGKEYIIKKDDIYDYINNNKSNYFINNRYFEKYILSYSILNISILLWLNNIFIQIDTIPIFSYFTITKYRVYIFISKMLDYIIIKNMDSIIIYIAKGHMS